jgi:hypothetical protein
MSKERYLLYVQRGVGGWQFKNLFFKLKEAKASLKRNSEGSKKKYKLIKETFIGTAVNGKISKDRKGV